MIATRHWHDIFKFKFLNDKSCMWIQIHDDVIKWKHIPRYWPFVRGIHRSPVNSAHKGQWRGALMFSLICVWINGWVNNREVDDLRRYRAHYDVRAMLLKFGPVQRQTIIRNIGSLTLIELLKTIIKEIGIKVDEFACKKIPLKMSPAKRFSFCLSGHFVFSINSETETWIPGAILRKRKLFHRCCDLDLTCNNCVFR